MKVIVVTGAPGAGKTTLLPQLMEVLPSAAAFLDGDDVGRTRPANLTAERLNLIQDNMLACARNFAGWGAAYLVACFCLPSQERVDRLRTLLRAEGFPVLAVGLILDDEVLAGRHEGSEYIAEALRCNAGVKALSGVMTIDTTALSPEQTARAIAEAAGHDAFFS